MAPSRAQEYDALYRLIDEYRVRCLWFLREEYYPRTPAEAIQVLDAIQRHGDVEAFQRAGALKRWLSASSSAKSAGS